MPDSDTPPFEPPAQPAPHDPFALLAQLPEGATRREELLLAGHLLDNHIECPKCRYDLCNLRTGQCPECGEPLKSQVKLERPAVNGAWITMIVFLSMGAGLGIPFFLVMMLSGFRLSIFGPTVCSSIVFIACIPLLLAALRTRERFMRSGEDNQRTLAAFSAIGVSIGILILLGTLFGIR